MFNILKKRVVLTTCHRYTNGFLRPILLNNKCKYTTEETTTNQQNETQNKIEVQQVGKRKLPKGKSLIPGYDYVVPHPVVEEGIEYGRMLSAFFDEQYENNVKHDMVAMHEAYHQNLLIEKGELTFEDVVRQEKIKYQKRLEELKEREARNEIRIHGVNIQIEDWEPGTPIEETFKSIFEGDDKSKHQRIFPTFSAWLMRQTPYKRKVVAKWLIKAGRKDIEKKFRIAFIRSELTKAHYNHPANYRKEWEKQQWFEDDRAPNELPPILGLYKDPAIAAIMEAVELQAQEAPEDSPDAYLSKGQLYKKIAEKYHAPNTGLDRYFDQFTEGYSKFLIDELNAGVPEKRFRGNLGVFNDYDLKDRNLIDPNDPVYLGLEALVAIENPDIYQMSDEDRELYRIMYDEDPPTSESDEKLEHLKEVFPFDTTRLTREINNLRRLASGSLNREGLGKPEMFIPQDMDHLSGEYPDYGDHPENVDPWDPLGDTAIEILTSEPVRVDEYFQQLMDESKLGHWSADMYFNVHTVESRVTNATQEGGRRESFNTFIIIGNPAGYVGLGFGEGKTPDSALRKAKKDAFRNLRSLELPADFKIRRMHEARYRSILLYMYPRSKPGVKAHPLLKLMCYYLGIDGVSLSWHGKRNLVSMCKAFMVLIDNITSVEEEAQTRGMLPIYTGTNYGDFCERLRNNRGAFGWH